MALMLLAGRRVVLYVRSALDRMVSKHKSLMNTRECIPTTIYFIL
jgi:hypothetical protein